MALSISNSIPATARFNEETRLNLFGSDFVSNVEVFILDIEDVEHGCTNIEIFDSGELICIMPSGIEIGAHDIIVRIGSEEAILNNGIFIVESFPEFPFENETFNNIQSRLLSRLPAGSDIRQGSTYWDIYAPAAIEFEKAYLNLAEGIRLGLLTHTTDDFLRMKAIEYGITQRSRRKAEVVLSFTTVNNGAVIPVGTIVTNELNSGQEPIEFETVEQLVLSNAQETGSVNAIAIDYGERYNVVADTLTRLATPITNIDTVTNNDASFGGRNNEETERLRSRALRRARNPSRGGNTADYIYWIENAFSEIDKVGVFPLKRGNGTVNVALLGIDDSLLSSSKINEIQDYISILNTNDGTRIAPIGADVLIYNAQLIDCSISVNINLQFGIILSSIASIIKRRIVDYFDSLEIGQIASRFDLGNAIEMVDGVVSINSLEIRRNDGHTEYEYQDSRNLTLDSANDDPIDIWSYGEYLYVLEHSSLDVFRYNLTDNSRRCRLYIPSSRIYRC